MFDRRIHKFSWADVCNPRTILDHLESKFELQKHSSLMQNKQQSYQKTSCSPFILFLPTSTPATLPDFLTFQDHLCWSVSMFKRFFCLLHIYSCVAEVYPSNCKFKARVSSTSFLVSPKSPLVGQWVKSLGVQSPIHPTII